MATRYEAFVSMLGLPDADEWPRIASSGRDQHTARNAVPPSPQNGVAGEAKPAEGENRTLANAPRTCVPRPSRYVRRRRSERRALGPSTRGDGDRHGPLLVQ